MAASNVVLKQVVLQEFLMKQEAKSKQHPSHASQNLKNSNT